MYEDVHCHRSIGEYDIRELSERSAQDEKAVDRNRGTQGNGYDRVKATSAYRFAVGGALATSILLFWVIGAVGLIGVEGDPFDLMYTGVLAVGIIGAMIARLRPQGMARALCATAVAQALVAVIALIVGKHHVEVSSVAEITLSNGFFVALWVGSAWLFRRAATGSSP